MSDEPDLDWDEDYEQQEGGSAEGRDHGRTRPLYPTFGPGDGRSWAQMFTEVKASRRGKVVNGQAELLDRYEVNDGDLTASPKKVLVAVKALGWKYMLSGSHVRVPPQFYINDSTTTGALAGDLKSEEKVETHTWMSAARPEARIGFSAHWVNGGFDAATVRDPVGIPIENYYEYKPIGTSRGKDETESSYQARVRRAEEDALERGYEYNDGSDRREHEVFYAQMSLFADWVDCWLNIWAPDAKRLTIKRKTKEERAMEKEEALLAGAEWS